LIITEAQNAPFFVFKRIWSVH